MTTLRQIFWVLALGVIGCFVFFFALGAITLGDATGLTIIVGVLCLMWLGHAWATSHAQGRDVRLTHDRERRGF